MSTRWISALLFSLVFVVLSAMNFPKTRPFIQEAGGFKRYIFLGHTYAWDRHAKVDLRIETINPSSFDRVWLGGDIGSEAFLNISSVQYLDDVFELAKPTTQYALGNHDIRNGNMAWYRDYTKKETYNYYSADGVVSVCLNSQLNSSLCEELENQWMMLANIIDTISISKHLFIFHHAGIYSGVPGIPPTSSFGHTNWKYWNINCDSSEATFSKIVYPRLVELKNRGIEVYCIMGDLGDNKKKFHGLSLDSVHFFGSGINNSKYNNDPVELEKQPKDLVLIFDHNINTQEISWKFHDLDSLANE
jgi:hypothetical protein